MADYPIESQLVINSSGQLIPGGKVYVYDSDDTGNTTPLALSDPNGLPISNPLTTSAISTTPEIRTPVMLVKMVGENGAQLTVLSAKGVVQIAQDAEAFVKSIDVGSVATADPDSPAQVTLDSAGKFGFVIPKGKPGKDGATVLPTDDAVAQAVNDKASAAAAAVAARARETAGVKVDPLEGVYFVNYGDSYGQGTQGADQNSRPFNRIAKRHMTQDLIVRAVAGKRMDEIAQNVFDTWTPNSRGLIGFSDGCINDLKQYANDTGRTTTREAFRSALAMLTAKAVNKVGSAAMTFSPGWSAGASATAGDFARVAVTAPTVYLLVGFYAGAGGTLTIANGATTLATVNTGGYANNIIGAVKVTGLTGTTELTVTNTAGTARIYGVAVPAATPPLIVWDKPGRYSADSTEANRLALYLSECSSILPDFPTVIQVDMGAGWDYTKMISPDNTHRNDYGNAYAANRIDAELSNFLGGVPRQGLNRVSLPNSETGADVAYATPSASPIITYTTYAADSFDRADSTTLGNTPTGGFAWQTINSGVWSISGNTLTANAATASTAPNDVFIDDGQANGTLSVKFLRNPTYSTGMCFRVTGAGNINGYIVWSNNGTLTLSKRNGANSYAALATGGAIASGDTVKVVLNGSSIRVLLNNTEVINVTDATYTGTKHGLWSNGTGAAATSAVFDNFSHDDRTT